MYFQLGRTSFEVQIADGSPTVDGSPCDGTIDFTAGLIVLADHLSAEDRAHTLFHELRHWWTRHHGQPVGVEADCDSAAAFALEVGRQFEEQGGTPALAAMVAPGREVMRIESRTLIVDGPDARFNVKIRKRP